MGERLVGKAGGKHCGTGRSLCSGCSPVAQSKIRMLNNVHVFLIIQKLFSGLFMKCLYEAIRLGADNCKYCCLTQTHFSRSYLSFTANITVDYITMAIGECNIFHFLSIYFRCLCLILSLEVQLCFGSLRRCFGSQAWSVFYTGVIRES